jgi:chromosome segregation ATPase|tara:strand:+ start:10179 stop:10817 length:639 start_codon:yes stop_codon:yes gene_type:complete
MMGQDDSAGADPQQTIQELEQQAAKDKEALDKLLVAYQAQEADLSEMKVQVETMNRELIDKETEKEGINNLLSNLRRQKDEMEVDLAKADTKIPYLESKLEKTEELLDREKARLGQVLTVAEEIDESNQSAQSELAARDDWYVQHMQLFEELNEAIQTRHDMIDRAIATAKDIHSKQESFQAQKQAVIEEIKEMASEDEGQDETKESSSENE